MGEETVVTTTNGDTADGAASVTLSTPSNASTVALAPGIGKTVTWRPRTDGRTLQSLASMMGRSASAPGWSADGWPPAVPALEEELRQATNAFRATHGGGIPLPLHPTLTA